MSLTLNSRDWTDLAKCKNMDKSVFFPTPTAESRGLRLSVPPALYLPSVFSTQPTMT